MPSEHEPTNPRKHWAMADSNVSRCADAAEAHRASSLTSPAGTNGNVRDEGPAR